MTNQSFDSSSINCNAEDALSELTSAANRSDALIKEWEKANNAQAIAAVLGANDPRYNKQAKRSAQVLRSRKIEIPLIQAAKTTANQDAGQSKAWMLPPDQNGTLLIAIGQGRESERWDTVIVYIQEGRGIARIDNNRAALSKLKENLRLAAENSGLSAFEIPVEWARSRVESARLQHVKYNPLPMGYTSAAALLLPLPESSEHPFDEEGLELAEEDAKDIAKDSAEMHRWPEFRFWLPPASAAQEMMVAIGNRIDPSKEPNEQKIDETIREEILNATDRYFTPERREQLVIGLKDAGLSVLARLGEVEALRVAAIIQRVQKAGLTENTPSELPFLRTFFDKAIGLLISQGDGQLKIPVPKPTAG